MHSLPLAVKEPGRRMGRDKSEDLPMTVGSLALAGLQGWDLGVILTDDVACFVERLVLSAVLI